MNAVRWDAWSQPTRLDSEKIYRGLHIGSAPPTGTAVRKHGKHGFDVLVLCAAELRPSQPAQSFPGVQVIYADMHDSDERSDIHNARRVARQVVAARRAGKRILVTCAQGRNRSGLVLALALHELTGWDGRTVLQHIRARRARALTNPWYAAYVKGLRGPRGLQWGSPT